jgi:uncharacterized protein YjlB
MRSLAELVAPVQQLNIIRHYLKDDGTFPNNGLLPLLVYRKALHLPGEDDARLIQELFETNGWSNAWTDGIFNYHHYHSNTHEVLGVIKGSTRVQFGGDSGISLMLEVGDVVIIPAGVAHKNLGGDEDFRCVGAYPGGKEYNINYGKPEERPRADETIRSVHLPNTDPVYGVVGPLLSNWENKIEDETTVL